MTQTAFGRQLGEKGFTSGRETADPGKGRKFWRGIGIKVSERAEAGSNGEQSEQSEACSGSLQASRVVVSTSDGRMPATGSAGTGRLKSLQQKHETCLRRLRGSSIGGGRLRGVVARVPRVPSGWR